VHLSVIWWQSSSASFICAKVYIRHFFLVHRVATVHLEPCSLLVSILIQRGGTIFARRYNKRTHTACCTCEILILETHTLSGPDSNRQPCGRQTSSILTIKFTFCIHLVSILMCYEYDTHKYYTKLRPTQLKFD
jgi:hypothetical protein